GNESVAIEIGAGHAESRAARRPDARRLRDINKLAAAYVAEQAGGHGAIRSGRAVIRLARRSEASLIASDREVNVVADEEVEAAVSVVINEPPPPRPTRVVKS